MAYGLASFVACVVLVSLSLVADGERVNRRTLSPLDHFECSMKIAESRFQLSERIHVYVAPPCSVDAFELTEEVLKAICTPQCFNNEVLSTPLSGVQEILDHCGTDPDFADFQTAYAMVRVMDEGRATCIQEEMEPQSQSSDCSKKIAEKSSQVMDRTLIYSTPPCSVDGSMIDPTFGLSEEGMKAICAPQCFNNEVLSTPLSGVQEILDHCGTDPRFPVFEASYEMLSSTYERLRVMDEGRATCTQEPPICEARDGYEVKIFGRECIYTPAPCKITGAVGDGLECQCMPKLTGRIEWMGDIPRGECFAEIVQLFDGAKRWEYSGKNVKCCVSSDGKPTEIVDMNAQELPNARSVGHRTGCGRMFGNTYHNALGKHFGFPSCVVAITKVMDMFGTDFSTVLSLVPDPIRPRLTSLSRYIDEYDIPLS